MQLLLLEKKKKLDKSSILDNYVYICFRYVASSFCFILGKFLNILECIYFNNQVNWSSGMILA